jgi:predicted ABC-type ATPase
VQERDRKGGHSIPDDDVRRRFHRTLANYWRLYRKIADNWSLIYNAGNGFQTVAIGDMDGYSLRDTFLFQRFLQLIEEAGDE